MKSLAMKVPKILGVVLAAVVLLVVGYELGARSVKLSPIMSLEVSGLVIDGGPIRKPAKWRM